jgi:2-hydroxy-3-keto-5-methylthiopentenyl-1-phosphate phosphatase
LLAELVEALIVFKVCKSLCCSKSVKLVEAKKLRTDLSNKVVLEGLLEEESINFLEFDEYKEVLKDILRIKYD